MGGCGHVVFVCESVRVSFLPVLAFLGSFFFAFCLFFFFFCFVFSLFQFGTLLCGPRRFAAWLNECEDGRVRVRERDR